MINAYVGHDRTRKANIGRRGHIYQAATCTAKDEVDNDNPYESPWRDLSQGMDALAMSCITYTQLMLALQCHQGT